MAHYRISALARRHLKEIAEYTIEAYGENQAEAYLAGFESIFKLITSFPQMGAVAFELKHGLRRHKYQKHHVYYCSDVDGVLIEAVFHVAVNMRPELFE